MIDRIETFIADPESADSDGDGTSDGGWEERREYAMSLEQDVAERTTQLQILNHDLQQMNQKLQKAHFVGRSLRLYAKVVHQFAECPPSRPRRTKARIRFLAKIFATSASWLTSTTVKARSRTVCWKKPARSSDVS